jgi:hypothetical protein
MAKVCAFLLLAGGLTLAACAGGDDVEATFTPGVGGGHVTGGGAGDPGTGAGGPSSSSGEASSSSSASSSSGSSSSSSTGSTGGGPPSCTYTSPNACANAQGITTIDGDDGNDMRIEKGTTSKWFELYVYEASSLIYGMSFTTTLDVPPGMNYGLYVYTGDDSSTNCAASPFAGEGNPPSVTLTWDDTIAVDDSYWFAIEVRYEDGSLCGPEAEWTLAIEGHSVP